MAGEQENENTRSPKVGRRLAEEAQKDRHQSSSGGPPSAATLNP